MAQTLVEAASGIASATADIVDALRREGFVIPVACTRKNFPGTRAIAAKAVRAGGGVMHRLGLSETLLVFPEHRAFVRAAGPARSAGAACVRRSPRSGWWSRSRDADEAVALARAGRRCCSSSASRRPRCARCASGSPAEGLHAALAPAGGVTLANALDYARAGADLLVTSAPYFAPPADVKVTIAQRHAG